MNLFQSEKWNMSYACCRVDKNHIGVLINNKLLEYLKRALRIPWLGIQVSISYFNKLGRLLILLTLLCNFFLQFSSNSYIFSYCFKTFLHIRPSINTITNSSLGLNKSYVFTDLLYQYILCLSIIFIRKRKFLLLFYFFLITR